MLAPEKRREKNQLHVPADVKCFLQKTQGGLTFDVSVDDHVAVQVRHPLQDLPRVAPRHVFCQRAVRLQLVLNGALWAASTKTGTRSSYSPTTHFLLCHLSV